MDDIAKMYRTSHDLEMSLQLACSSLERVPVGCGKKLLRANRVVAEIDSRMQPLLAYSKSASRILIIIIKFPEYADRIPSW